MKTVVETIKERLPITEVLSSYIAVQQSGNQFKAKCPFHNERTASFYISTDRGLYYCFGCGAKGDIFSFVEQFEGLDFKGTLKLLAERAGVSLVNNTDTFSDKDPVYEILEKATSLYQSILSKTKIAQDYLLNRGLTKETIEAFHIGYTPDDWHTVDSLCKDKKDYETATRAGLVKNTQGKTYDRFRKRILFPLTDSSGRVIGFSGRSFPEEDGVPKYLNSPETELFQKSKTLFGFDKAKFYIKKNNFAILVEGQMDLVISHQAGFRNTVASSGTALSEDSAKDPFSNLSVLSRLTQNIFLAFDGDIAGQNAMDKAALIFLSLGMNPKVVVLPEGVDPADFIKENGSDAWKDKLKESRHFIDHHLVLIRKQELSPHVFAKTIKEKLFPFLNKVSSPIEKNLYIKTISQEIGIPELTINQELSMVHKKTEEVVVIKKDSPPDITPYERLIALRQCFKSDDIEKAVEALNDLVIGDMVFSEPAVPEDRLARALIVVERDYSALSSTDQVKVAEELVVKIIETFLTNARINYSSKLKQAEIQKQEQDIIRFSDIIQHINLRLHKRSGA